MERTCLVTKQKLAVANLLRFTVHDGSLIFDQAVKNPGRGGYVIKDLKAVEKLPKLKSKIKYQLRVEGNFEISQAALDIAKNLLN